MDQNSYSKESRGPYLRRITPSRHSPRLLALAGFGAGAVFAGAVAAAVYFNAVSNPPVMDNVSLDPAVASATSASVPMSEAPNASPAPETGAQPEASQDAPAANVTLASSQVDPEQKPVLAPSAITIVQSPLEPKRVTTMVIRPDAPVPAADDPRWAAAAQVPRNKALDALREKLAANDDASAEDDTPDRTVTAALAPSDPPKGEPLARSAATETEPAKTSKKALVSQAVKMRAGPNGKSAVVGVLPARAEVRLGPCKGWCQVSYQGKAGYVWKSFLRPAKPLNALAGG